MADALPRLPRRPRAFSFQIFSTYPAYVELDVTFAHELIALVLLIGARDRRGDARGVLRCREASAGCVQWRRGRDDPLQLWLLLLLTVARQTALVPFDCVDVGERRVLRQPPPCDVAGWYVLGALGGIGTIVYRSASRCSASSARDGHRSLHEDVRPPHAGGADRRRPRRRLQQEEGRLPRQAWAGEGAATRQRRSALEAPRACGARHSRQAQLLLKSYQPAYWSGSLEVLRAFLMSAVLVIKPHLYRSTWG